MSKFHAPVIARPTLRHPPPVNGVPISPDAGGAVKNNHAGTAAPAGSCQCLCPHSAWPHAHCPPSWRLPGKVPLIADLLAVAQ